MMPTICPYREVCKEYRLEGIMCNFTIGERDNNCPDYKQYRQQVGHKHKEGLAKLFDFKEWFK